MVSALLWGPGGSFIVFHHGERELKHSIPAGLSQWLTASTVASDSHLQPDRPNSAATPAAVCSYGLQTDGIPPALSNHQTVTPSFSPHPFLSSSQLTKTALVSYQNNRAVQVASSLGLISEVTPNQ